MKAYVIMIGNSDNKLTQEQWADFIDQLLLAVANVEAQRQGTWYSEPVSNYQNMAVCFEMEHDNRPALDAYLKSLCAHFNQDSIAMLSGATEFVTA